MADTTLIRNGRLITPDGEIRGDLLLAGEKIAAIHPQLSTEGVDNFVDATGCIVLPGLIDPHTHIQLDTGIYKTPDDWEIGTRTAACGGVTTVIDFATQFPGQNVREALAARLAEINGASTGGSPGLAQIDYGLHMMLTQLPPTDAELDCWMTELLANGINSVKIYTTYRPNYYQDDAALLRVFEAAARHDMIVMIHCENDAIVSAATAALIDAGQTALAHHGQARPALAEVEAAHRALFLAETVGATIYVVHCSVCGTVDQVIQAVARGQRAIAETTPQYLLLDETVYAGEHPEWGIMQPPLRAPVEKDGLWEQLTSGAISTIGTDHCDYTIEQKQLSPHFHKTAGGIPGMETLLPLLATYGVGQSRITWSQLAALTSANPARIFGLKGKGQLAPGYDADVVIYDMQAETTIRAESLHSWLRPHLQIHRGMPKWLLPLLQLFWNHHQFERGKRAGNSPLELAGVADAPSLAGVLGSLFGSSQAVQPA